MGTFDEAARRAEEEAAQERAVGEERKARRVAFVQRAHDELAQLGPALVQTLTARGVQPQTHELYCTKYDRKGRPVHVGAGVRVKTLRKKVRGWSVTVDNSTPSGEGYGSHPGWFLKADGTWLRREELFGRHAYVSGRPPYPFPGLAEMPDGSLGIRDWYGKVNALQPILERFINTEIMRARRGR